MSAAAWARRATPTFALGVALATCVAVARADPAATQSFSRPAAEAAYERAAALVKRGDVYAAVSAYTEAIRLDPSYGAPYLGLSDIRRALGDLQDAEWLLTQATRLADVSAEAHSRRARFYRTLGKNELALFDMQLAVEQGPTPERLRELATAYVERRAWPGALAAYRRLRAQLSEHGPERELRELSDTIQALSVLVAEADAPQNADGHAWIRRSLRQLARR